MKKKLYFASLGCVRNLVDSEIMIGFLNKEGFFLTLNMQEADILVVNSCAFLKQSREETFSVIEELLENKKKGAKLIVAGCMITRHLNELKEKFPEVFSYIGAFDLDKIIEAIKKSSEFNKQEFFQVSSSPRSIVTKHFAYLKIAEGCRKNCSFCIIPKIKGPLKSRLEDDILEEFKSLLDQGFFEIILIAQDLGDFGKDRGDKNALCSLIKKMLKIKKDFWLRLLYVYPDEISDELINLIKSDSRICPYIDMPIQHIDDDILHFMRRKTSQKDIISIIEKLREVPNFVIRTSLIVGFPSETDEKFESLLNFIKKYPLDNIGIFKFSREKDSASYDFSNQVSEDVKQKRFEKLSKTQLEIVREKNKKMIGKTLNALALTFHENSNLLIKARYQGQAPDIDGNIIINDISKIKSFGKVYPIKITGFSDYDLIGEVD
jgi:ribosomal protein S12 methylthiotransferase